MADQNIHATYYPRLVIMAHQMASKVNAPWLPRSSSMLRLIRAGEEAASRRIGYIQITDLAWWSLLTEEERVEEAVTAAKHAMIGHVISELLLANT